MAKRRGTDVSAVTNNHATSAEGHQQDVSRKGRATDLKRSNGPGVEPAENLSHTKEGGGGKGGEEWSAEVNPGRGVTEEAGWPPTVLTLGGTKRNTGGDSVLSCVQPRARVQAGRGKKKS